MEIKIDPMFDTMAQVINKIQRDIGNTLPNPDPFNRLDFEFDTSRQAYAKMLERTGYNPPRTFKTEEFGQTYREPPKIRIEIPTPREELMMHDPPMFRRRPALEPINFKDPMNHPHLIPELPKVTKPSFTPNIFEKKKEPWEL